MKTLGLFLIHQIFKRQSDRIDVAIIKKVPFNNYSI